MLAITPPTPDLALNAVLDELVRGAQAILGDLFTGAYLQGSFATGGWDAASDVDFLIVVERELPEALLPALRALHPRIYEMHSNWARHLEGSYFPKDLLRSGASAGQELWYIDNGSRELVRSPHDNTLVVRWVMREHGICMAGPAAAALVDPVDPEALRAEVRAVMRDWGRQLMENPEKMNTRWYQPFAVLSFCRMLHTLATARIVSKRAGSLWAIDALDPRWVGLIERAWAERPNPDLKGRQPADPQEIAETAAFIRYALEMAGT